MQTSPLLTQLMEALRCLPGVGPKSAQRMAFTLLQRDRSGGMRLAQALTRAYTTLRDELHHLALQEQPGHVALDCFVAERAQVTASWQKWLVEPCVTNQV